MEKEEVEISRVDAEKSEEDEQRYVIKWKSGMKWRDENESEMSMKLKMLVMLIIFCGILIWPLELLLKDISYEVEKEEKPREIERSIYRPNFLSSKKFRERKLCPGLFYEYLLSSIYFSNYDRNCSHTRKRVMALEEPVGENKNAEKWICMSEKMMNTETVIDNSNGMFEQEIRTTKPKSTLLSAHILAMILVVSAVAAFVEVLRIRFINSKDTSTVETAGSRKGSTVELNFHGRFLPRPRIKPQRSFDLQGMQRSAQRFLGTQSPTLTRRSSFPSYHVGTMDLATINDASMSRRTSINPIPESTLEFGMANIHRRARLIRRH